MRTYFALVLLLGGCGNVATSDTPPAPAMGVQLLAGPYNLPAGTEKYYCYATTLPAGAKIAINQVDSFQGKEVHHMALFRTLLPEPEGFSECPSLIKQTWVPVYANGTGNHSLQLPPDTGFVLPAETQLLVQLHLLNATPDDVTGNKTFVNVSYAPNPAAVTPAGIWAWGNYQVDIPAGATNYQLTSDCMLTRDLNIFGWFPHLHKLGTSLQVEYGAGPDSASVVYKRDPWVFGEQAIDTAAMTLKKGSWTRATCSYNNTTGHEVKFGESSNDEMCFMVAFYTPFNALDGCIVGDPPAGE